MQTLEIFQFYSRSSKLIILIDIAGLETLSILQQIFRLADVITDAVAIYIFQFYSRSSGGVSVVGDFYGVSTFNSIVDLPEQLEKYGSALAAIAFNSIVDLLKFNNEKIICINI